MACQSNWSEVSPDVRRGRATLQREEFILVAVSGICECGGLQRGGAEDLEWDVPGSCLPHATAGTDRPLRRCLTRRWPGSCQGSRGRPRGGCTRQLRVSMGQSVQCSVPPNGLEEDAPRKPGGAVGLNRHADLRDGVGTVAHGFAVHVGTYKALATPGTKAQILDW